MTEDEYQQAVAALSSMISTWLQRRAREAKGDDRRDLGAEERRRVRRTLGAQR
jgi:hypothetical protein